MEKPSAENAIIKFTGDIMIIDEKTYNRMPKKLQYMFNKLPNPGSDEVLAEFAKAGERKSGGSSGKRKSGPYSNERTWSVSTTPGADVKGGLPPDTGTAARFFYCAKSSRAERNAGLEGMEDFTLKDGVPENIVDEIKRLLDL